jgi:serine/threonine-protein kinase
MELSPGRSLAEVFRNEGPLESSRVLRILVDLCDSLAEAHGLGVVHRDLKPENILIEDRSGGRDFAKLSDFGLAKLLPANTHLSAPGQAIGAIEFSSPEQLLHQTMDARSDLYGLGVLGYLLITGKHPFHGVRSVAEMVEAHVSRLATPASSLRSDVPPDVDAILARLLAKDPDRRFPDASSLAALLNILISTVLPMDPTETIREPDLGEEDTAYGDVPKRDD